jgi:hypothetical protein
MLRRSSFSPRYVDTVAAIVPLFTSQLASDWGSFGGADTFDQATTPTSPGGTSKWIKLTFDSAGSHWHYAPTSAVMVGSGQIVTPSIHLLDGTSHFVTFMAAAFDDMTAFFSVTVNLTTGAITQTQHGANGTLSASHIVANTSGGFRVDMTGSIAATDLFLILQPEASGTPTLDASTGYNSGLTGVAGQNFYFWGAEVDPGSTVQPYPGH